MSYTCLRFHIVFSTKERRRWVAPDMLPRLIDYVAGMIKTLHGQAIEINGPEDHLHILTALPPALALADAMRDIKANSSNWIHEAFPELRGFAWQDGYAGFSVSRSGVDAVAAYIRNQQEHHKKMTFEEELKLLLEKHGIPYDPKYL